MSFWASSLPESAGKCIASSRGPTGSGIRKATWHVLIFAPFCCHPRGSFLGSFRIGISRAEQGRPRRFLLRLGGLGGKSFQKCRGRLQNPLGKTNPGLLTLPESSQTWGSALRIFRAAEKSGFREEIRGRARRSWPLSSPPRRQKVEFWNFSGFAGSRSEIFISAKGSRYRNAAGIPIAL